MAKKAEFKSAVLIRRISKFEEAVQDRSWKGFQPPDTHENIEKRYHKARLALIEYVIEHTI